MISVKPPTATIPTRGWIHHSAISGPSNRTALLR